MQEDTYIKLLESLDKIVKIAREGQAHIVSGHAMGRTDVSGTSALERIRLEAQDVAHWARERDPIG